MVAKNKRLKGRGFKPGDRVSDSISGDYGTVVGRNLRFDIFGDGIEDDYVLVRFDGFESDSIISASALTMLKRRGSR